MFNNILIIFSGLLGNNFNDILIFFLIILTVCWFAWYDIGKLARIRNSFFRVCGKMEKIKGSSIKNVKVLDDLFDATVYKPIRDVWAEFYEDCRAFRHKEKTPDINLYFDMHKAVVVPSCRKRADIVPGTLLKLGILGMLLSMTIGLTELDFSGSGIVTRENVGQLLNIAASAFTIFIAAIILSIVFQLLDRLLYQSAVTQMGRFLSRAARLMPMVNDSLNIELLVKEQRSQSEGLQQLGENISSRLSDFIGQSMVPSINKTFEEAVGRQIIPSVKSMIDTLRQISRAVLDTQANGMEAMANSFIDKLNSAMGIQLKSFGGNIQRLLDSQSKADQSINRLMEELVKNADIQKSLGAEAGAIMNVLYEYHNHVKANNAALVDSIEKMALFNSELREVMQSDRQSLEELKDQRAAMQKESREYVESMDGQVRRLMEELNLQLDAAFSRFNDITSMAFDRMEKTMDSTVEGMSTNMKLLFDSVDDQVRDISLYARGLSEEVNELNGRLESSMKEFGRQMSDGVVNTLNTFDSGLGEICSRFGRVICDVRDTIEELPEIAAAAAKNGEDIGEMKNGMKDGEQ